MKPLYVTPKERINFIVDAKSGSLCGYPVNMRSITVSAKTKEELAKKCKKAMRHMMSLFDRILNSEDPFELSEYKNISEWLDPDQKIAKLERELQRYKDTFGEI
jgi:hypothetical protein